MRKELNGEAYATPPQTQGSILLIDDDDAVRSVIAQFLEKAGFEVIQAPDGAEGLRRYHECHPDVVVCDLRMPEVDGMSVLRELSALDQAPIIVISGAGVMSDVVEALRLGASDYFIKPIADMALLEHSIRRCLEAVKLQRENIRYREELESANRKLEANLRMLQQDQQAGRHIQMRLLPSSPKSFGPYTFRHRIYPSLYLSGDFVEYTLVGENKVTFFIADISGHGASSAFVTALLKNFTAHLRSDFRNHGREHIIRPKRFLEKVSYDMLRTGIGKHMTMCIGVLDMSTNRLSYSVAGHLPQPVLISPGQKPRYLEGKGMPAGMFENPVFEEREIALPDTFTLLMFSDGILEILPPTELVDKEQLLLKLLESCPCKLEELADCLGLNEASDAPDDIAILMLTKE